MWPQRYTKYKKDIKRTDIILRRKYTHLNLKWPFLNQFVNNLCLASHTSLYIIKKYKNISTIVLLPHCLVSGRVYGSSCDFTTLNQCYHGLITGKSLKSWRVSEEH